MEIFISRITGWHHKACIAMTNGDPKGQIFFPHPNTNYRFFFLLSPLNSYFKISLNMLRCNIT